MGCDIHAMIEGKYHWRYSAEAWSWQSCGRVHIARNYALFAALANVRNYGQVQAISEPRFEEVPDHDTWKGDDNLCSEDFSHLCDGWGSDAHSHSWVKLDELQTVDADLAARCRLIVLAHGLKPEEARLSFFFDN